MKYTRPIQNVPKVTHGHRQQVKEATMVLRYGGFPTYTARVTREQLDEAYSTLRRAYEANQGETK